MREDSLPPAKGKSWEHDFANIKTNDSYQLRTQYERMHQTGLLCLELTVPPTNAQELSGIPFLSVSKEVAQIPLVRYSHTQHKYPLPAFCLPVQLPNLQQPLPSLVARLRCVRSPV